MADEIPTTGVKISDGDWKSLNNRLEAIDKILKTTTTTITDQDKKITELSVPQNIVQVRMNQFNSASNSAVHIPIDDTVPQNTKAMKL